jgi:hypothetical protein
MVAPTNIDIWQEAVETKYSTFLTALGLYNTTPTPPYSLLLSAGFFLKPVFLQQFLCSRASFRVLLCSARKPSCPVRLTVAPRVFFTDT